MDLQYFCGYHQFSLVTKVVVNALWMHLTEIHFKILVYIVN